MDGANVLTCAEAMRNRITFRIKTVQTSGPLPTYPDLVWVQCKEHTCLAYVDATGNWINFYTGKKITDFVKVIG